MTRLGHDHEVATGAGQTEPDNLRAFAELHRRDTAGDHAHRAYALFVEANRVAVARHEQILVLAQAQRRAN